MASADKTDSNNEYPLLSVLLRGGQDTSEPGLMRNRNPSGVEVYIGAMESYVHFDMAGIHWKLPEAMLVEMIELYRQQKSE